ncbi:carbon storage regulator [Virgibacillus necropolis]|uniref:Carbon storage regulator n=1 Tax=Virgibacillus necropolis TaxID=163877 RepID=A0A221MAJ3_9BACI|nr:carbon storage regulator [Virgibacillus necropolis]ASN04678.1 carbon storage regulator [Virgibacillus necropolis]
MALTLRRNPGEKLYIIDPNGNEIEIEIVKGDRNKPEDYMRLRVNAPKDYKVLRGELYDGFVNNSL